MPPKTKITSDAILRAAIEITREKGIAAVTAAEVAKRLHCSTQPVYWTYKTMESLRLAVTEAAAKQYLLRQREGLDKLQNADAVARYKSTGLNYINFARTEPELFKALFMSCREGENSLFESELDGNKAELVGLIKSGTGLDDKRANTLYADLWIFSHGIAAMLVTRTVALSSEQIEQMMYHAFRGILHMLQKE